MTWSSRVFTRFFYDLTYWPTFWPDMTHIQTWPRYYHDDHSEQVWWWLDHKLWPLECSQGFSMIWPTDLLFDPTWPIFELDRDIVMMIILSKFDDDWTKTVASRMFTRFFYDLTYWPTFWSDMTHIQSWPTYYHYDHSEQLWCNDWTKTVVSRVFTRFFYDLTYWPTFSPDMAYIQTWPRYHHDDHSE